MVARDRTSRVAALHRRYFAICIGLPVLDVCGDKVDARDGAHKGLLGQVQAFLVQHAPCEVWSSSRGQTGVGILFTAFSHARGVSRSHLSASRPLLTIGECGGCQSRETKQASHHRLPQAPFMYVNLLHPSALDGIFGQNTSRRHSRQSLFPLTRGSR